MAVIAQGIEAQNLQHLLYGTAGAKTLACTFRVRSPKTGTHYVGLTQLDTERYYLRSYTVDVADTWETKTVTFPGDVSGVINSDTGEGLRLFFALHGAGANFGSGVADAWTAWPAGVIQYMASDGVNVLDNAANNFYLAGVQLEVGSAATDFEHEDYGTTLVKCQRYFYRQTDASLGARIITGFATSGTSSQYAFRYPVVMRSAPTLSFSAAADFSVAYDATAVNVTALSLALANTHSGRLTATATAGAAGDAVQLAFDGGGTRWFAFDAEL